MSFPSRSMYQHITRTTVIVATAIMISHAPGTAAQVPYNGTAALALSVGTRLAAMATGLEDAQWSDTDAVYTTDASPYPSLRSLGQTHVAPPVAPSRERQIFAAFWGSQTYADDFVTAAITANTTFWGVDLGLHVDGNKTREELAMKGVSLQTAILAMLDNLHGAWVACVQGRTLDSENLVGDSWGYYAANKGPMALGEKRCPQFDTCTTTVLVINGMNITSSVNHAINTQYLLASQSSRTGMCSALSDARDVIRSQIFVPVIQGMVREAYEVDPNGGAADADGFVERAEGWAFTAAVLPLIAECNPVNATTIRTNMDSLSTPPGQPVLLDGYLGVVRAVESVYPCLGIVCDDVKAMVDSTTGVPLWTSCTTLVVGSGSGDNGGVGSGWRTVVILFIVAIFVGALAFALYSRHKRRINAPRSGLKPMTLVNQPEFSSDNSTTESPI